MAKDPSASSLEKRVVGRPLSGSRRNADSSATDTLLCCLLAACTSAIAVMVACGGGGGSATTPPPQPEATGSLTINVGAVPGGAAATITVLGPNGFSQTLAQATTLNNLNTGTYLVSASMLPGQPGNNQVYVPAVSGSPAAVTANGTATASVTYGALSTVWQAMGPRAIHIRNGIPAAGKLQAIAVNLSNPSVIYVGGGIYNGPATESGVYKTTDGGQHWSQASNGLTDPIIGALWLDQATPNTLVAATFSTGLFQSTDGGQTWTLTGSLGSSNALLQIGNTLYAGTAQGIATSADSGHTWSVIESTAAPVRSLASGGSMIYAGLDNGQVLAQNSQGGAWETTTPTNQSGVTAESIVVNPTNPQNAFVVDMGYYNIPNYFVTTNGGATWTADVPTNAGGGQVSVQVTAFDPTGNALYAGADVFFGKSVDGGKTWTQVSAPNDSNPGAWYDERLIVAGPTPGQVLVAADQGLYLSADAGNTWQSLNGDLTSSIVYVVAVNGKTFICTMQDLGPVSSFDGGSTWDSAQSAKPAGSEGGTSLINPGNPNYAYVYTAWGFQLSTDGGYTYNYSSTLTGDSFPGCGGNSQLIAVDSQNTSTVYAAAYDCQQTQAGFAQGIYKSTDMGTTWTLQNWPITQPVMVAIDPTNDHNIFVGQADGNLKVSHDGGSTWKANPIGQIQGQVWWPVSLTVNPSAPNVVLVGMSGPPSAGGGVLRSIDGGNTFAQANSGLDVNNPQPWPDSIFRISYDPAGSGLVVASRFSGVYLSSDNGGAWVNVSGNVVPHTFSSATWDSGYLYASTFGEGVIRLSGPF